MDNDVDTSTYLVVRNDEEQYSIWPTGRQLPAGWYAEGTEGPRQVCLNRINEVWIDMRPLSLRCQMEEDVAHSLELTN